MLQALVANIAVVALVISLWVHAQQALEGRQVRYRSTLFSIAMGLGAAATVALPIEFAPGLPGFDLRIALVLAAALFSQPLVAIAAAAIAASMQVAVDPYDLWPGIAAIAAASALGILFYLRYGGPVYRPIYRALFSVLAGLIGAVCFMLPGVPFDTATIQGVLLVFALNAATTLACAEILIRGKRFAVERHLLRAAVTQAPDYFVIKDMRGRYVAVNNGVAQSFGFTSAADVIGKTDRDLVSAEHYAQICAAEAELVHSGVAAREIEEEVAWPDGRRVWLSTSRSALRDADGRIIGIAAVTRNITERRQREVEAERDHSLVNFALTEMSDGLAMFDPDGIMVLCNPHFSASFPRTASVRRPGVHIREIHEAVIETGEQLDLPTDAAGRRDWVEQRVAEMRNDCQTEAHLCDGRWVQIRTRPTSGGSALVVVSDVTSIKSSEMALQGMTDQLKELATTDGLTGLLNRRSFDQVLTNELARTGRERQPITLLMIDVDRFKAYNDRYGHPAGDKALKLVADSLRQAALRPGDSLARYGGEEFSAILPNTDEDGAYIIAERLRRALRDLGLPHEGSEKGIITVSVGIACYPDSGVERNEAELIRRADQALYDAKAAGRDRVTGWRGTTEVQPRSHYDTGRRAS